MQKTWMVLVDSTTFISKKHPTPEEAKLEAERLMLLPGNLGRGATILEAVQYGKMRREPIVWEPVE